ncbi:MULTISPECIES: hypothetical protein [unclassified Streptomyces]|uniref:hypothetical protein n=1 Tax=unclassified Streptomyces TaxID=2593676 RepID=UPI0016610775|nr:MULTISPECIES: hypothetical protein [unclassified Streptomyces]MBD0709308.1 hypothetical protein [Streptomyces sp. CBMA291]MBD0712602.1 hypothetical protein [Streptomyces sp. CBMA370]
MSASPLSLTGVASPVRALLAHPGYTATRLRTRDTSGLTRLFLGRIGPPLPAQRPERGVLPQLWAATVPEPDGGEFFGPDGPGELRGTPTGCGSPPRRPIPPGDDGSRRSRSA